MWFFGVLKVWMLIAESSNESIKVPSPLTPRVKTCLMLFFLAKFSNIARFVTSQMMMLGSAFSIKNSSSLAV